MPGFLNRQEVPHMFLVAPWASEKIVLGYLGRSIARAGAGVGRSCGTAAARTASWMTSRMAWASRSAASLIAGRFGACA
jgi:hypothetical protein